MLNAESIWNIETGSEPELDIRFNDEIREEDSASDNSTLQNVKRKTMKRKHTSPIKIIPDKLMVTFGDKTTTITNTRKQVARKTLARRTNEPRGTLKPLWNIIPDGTITNYSPTTITLDTQNRKNTVIRKNYLAIVNETKPRLMHFVACKTVREYKRNQEKIKEFLLTEKKTVKKNQLDQQQNECIPGPSSLMDQPGPSGTQLVQASKDKKQPKREGTAPIKRTYKRNKDFDQRSKEAAIAQTKLEKARQRQKNKTNSPRIQLDTTKLHKDKTVEIINIASDSSQGSPFQIYTSENPNAFKHPQTNTDIIKSKRDEKIDKIIRKITNSPQRTLVEPESEQLITIIPASTSTPIGNSTKKQQNIEVEKALKPTGNDDIYKPQQQTEKQTTKPTGQDKNIQKHKETHQTTVQQDNKANQTQQTNKEITDAPEERQDTNTETDSIHTEEQEDEYSGTSSDISSLNTADIEALNRIFD